MPNDIEAKAMRRAIHHYKKEKYVVENVSHKREHKGYDLLVERKGKKLKIEVKGCSREWGIPDPYITEFDSKGRLVANFLCVVYLIGSKKAKIYQIPRKDILKKYITKREGWRISGAFKKEEILKKYQVT